MAKKEYRFNIYDLIKSFYSFAFSNGEKITSNHIALYIFLVNQNNRLEWVEWFKVSLDVMLIGSCIGSKNTYYKCLKDLKAWGFIEYIPGVNDYKRTSFKLLSVKDSNSIPQPEKVEVQYITSINTSICDTTDTGSDTGSGTSSGKRNNNTSNLSPITSHNKSEFFYNELLIEFINSESWQETIAISDSRIKDADQVKSLMIEFCSVLKKADQFPIALKEAKNRFAGWMNKNINTSILPEPEQKLTTLPGVF